MCGAEVNLLVAADAPHGELPGITANYSACVDSVDQNATYPVYFNALAKCIDDETKIQDARLNRAYQSLIHRLTPAQAQSLRIEERRWIGEKQRNCTIPSDDDSQESQYLFVPNCILTKTTERANQLEKLLARANDELGKRVPQLEKRLSR